MKIAPSINIFSGGCELGASLTNASCLGVSKKILKKHVPIIYKGKKYDSVEKAYLALKTENHASNFEMMISMIAIKFLMHPDLAETVKNKGGVQWLESCDHQTFAKTERFQRWEGKGRNSLFIKALIAGYERYLSFNEEYPSEYYSDQSELF